MDPLGNTFEGTRALSRLRTWWPIFLSNQGYKPVSKRDREHTVPEICAGFFDPGFGVGADGAPGSRGVLEVRSHEVPFVLEDGQIVGRLAFEKMAAEPDALYGAIGTSNYQGQALKLSKHVKS